MGDAVPIVTYADGVTTFVSPTGDEIMAIADELVDDAWEEQSRRYQASIENVVFVEIDGQWYEAGMPSFESGWPQRLALGDGVITVGVGEYADGEFEGGWPGRPPTVFVGRIGA